MGPRFESDYCVSPADSVHCRSQWTNPNVSWKPEVTEDSQFLFFSTKWWKDVPAIGQIMLSWDCHFPKVVRSSTIPCRTDQTLGHDLIWFMTRTWRRWPFTPVIWRIMEMLAVLWSPRAINSAWSNDDFITVLSKERDVWADLSWLPHSQAHGIVFIGLRWWELRHASHLWGDLCIFKDSWSRLLEQTFNFPFVMF